MPRQWWEDENPKSDLYDVYSETGQDPSPMLTNDLETARAAKKEGRRVGFISDEDEGIVRKREGFDQVTQTDRMPQKPSDDELDINDLWMKHQPDVKRIYDEAFKGGIDEYKSNFGKPDIALMKPQQINAMKEKGMAYAKSKADKEVSDYRKVFWQTVSQQQAERKAQAKTPTDTDLIRQSLRDKYGREPSAQEILDSKQAIDINKIRETKSVQTEGIDIASLAQSIADGQDAPTAIKGSMGNPVASKVKTEVLKKYPKFDMMMADANYKWKQSATNQRTINFAGGALPRLGALDDQLAKMPNTDINTINRIMSVVSKEFGKPEYTNFESNRNAIVQEINTALSGTSQGSDLRIKIELENLKSARSPAQISGAISNLRMALEARMDVDLSPLYPIEVVRGEKSMEQYKKELFNKYRGNYSTKQKDSKKVTKKFFSKSTGKTKYVYSDGTEEIK
jgi:hypothetical protein